MARLRTLRLTNRGLGTAVVVLLAAGVGTLTANGLLLAAVAPGAIAFAVGIAQLVSADPPTVTRSGGDLEPGFPDERRTITVTIDSATPCWIEESIGDGLAFSTGDSPTASLGHGGRFEYAVELRQRGCHRLGPARCVLTDSLGLFHTTVEADDSDTILVYPQVYRLESGAIPQFGRQGTGDDRSTFDRLREFGSEDTMRDIHWRASAKQADGTLLVSEYRGAEDDSAVAIVGEATGDGGGVDEMASVVGSIAVHLALSGIAVTVHVPGGTHTAVPGETGELLRLLALTDGGRVPKQQRRSANVRVRGGETTTVRVSGREIDFESVSGASHGRAVVG
jgi:uncharacterized protein (DUF58 family)